MLNVQRCMSLLQVYPYHISLLKVRLNAPDGGALLPLLLLKPWTGASLSFIWLQTVFIDVGLGGLRLPYR